MQLSCQRRAFDPGTLFAILRCLSTFHLFAAVISLAALAGYVNYRLLRLPTAIGMTLTVLAFSAALLGLRALGVLDVEAAVRVVKSLQFGDIVLHGMLAFLLFAGALHVDLAKLRGEGVTVGLLATLGVIIATAVTGVLVWLAAGALGLDIPLLAALVFGAVVAPTDPIAVLGILRQAGVPQHLALQITGESLFNDGVAVVVFIALADAAFGAPPSAAHVAGFFALEVLGALALGAALGYAANRLLAQVDDYPVEILMSLALAAGGYSLAEVLHVSAPITVVVAGLLVGTHGRAFSMSERTRRRLDEFWELVDYVLNATLFVLIGLEVLALPIEALRGATPWLLAAGVAIVLLARLVGVAAPIGMLRATRRFAPGTIRMLTWGGLKGGISIALALSLPEFAQRDLLLAATYAVVVFSVLVQGLTLKPLAVRINSYPAAARTR